MTGNKERPETVGLPALSPLHHVALSSVLPKAEESGLMNSIAISCARAMSVDRASSQQSADECITREGYSHTRCMAVWTQTLC